MLVEVFCVEYVILILKVIVIIFLGWKIFMMYNYDNCNNFYLCVICIDFFICINVIEKYDWVWDDEYNVWCENVSLWCGEL